MTWLLINIGIVILWMFLCGSVGTLADRKGHSGLLWFFFSLFCSPVLGFLVVGLLPSAADLMPVGYAPCPYCSRTVKVGREICPYCHADLIRKKMAEKKAA
jgi:hypothetical protein